MGRMRQTTRRRQRGGNSLAEDAALGLRLLEISRKYSPVTVHPTDPALSTYTEEDLLKMSHELSQGLSGTNATAVQKKVEEEVEELLEEVIEKATPAEGGGKHKKKQKQKQKQKHSRTHKHARNLNSNNHESESLILKHESTASVPSTSGSLLLPGELVTALGTVGRPDEPVAPLSCLFRAYLSVKKITHAAWSTVSRPASQPSILTTLKSTSSILGTVCRGASYIPPLEPYATPLSTFFGITAATLAATNVAVRAVNHSTGVHPVSTANAIRIGSDALVYVAPYGGTPGTALGHVASIPGHLETGRSATNFSAIGSFSLNERNSRPKDPTVYNRMAAFLTKSGPI